MERKKKSIMSNDERDIIQEIEDMIRAGDEAGLDKIIDERLLLKPGEENSSIEKGKNLMKSIIESQTVKLQVLFSDKEVKKFLEEELERMCLAVMPNLDVPLVLEEGFADSLVLTYEGPTPLLDKPYNYAVARNIETKERINIITLNLDSDENSDLSNALVNVALALGDIVSFQLEELYRKKEIADNEELQDIFGLARSASAVALAYNALRYTSMPIIADLLALRIKMITEMSFEEFMELKEISTIDKIHSLTELMAIWFAEGEKIRNAWKSSHITFKTVERLESILHTIFDKMFIETDFESVLDENRYKIQEEINSLLDDGLDITSEDGAKYVTEIANKLEDIKVNVEDIEELKDILNNLESII